MAERGIAVDHVTVHRWVQRLSPLLADAARFARHRVGDRWQMDETYVKVAGRRSTCIGRSTSSGSSSTCTPRCGGTRRRPPVRRGRQDNHRCDSGAGHHRPGGHVSAVLDELRSAAWHHVERYANNRVEADHAQLKRRLRPMRGIKTMTGLRILAAGHAFVQNLRRGHYEIAADHPRNLRLVVAFGQLATAI